MRVSFCVRCSANSDARRGTPCSCAAWTTQQVVASSVLTDAERGAPSSESSPTYSPGPCSDEDDVAPFRRAGVGAQAPARGRCRASRRRSPSLSRIVWARNVARVAVRGERGEQRRAAAGPRSRRSPVGGACDGDGAGAGKSARRFGRRATAPSLSRPTPQRPTTIASAKRRPAPASRGCARARGRTWSRRAGRRTRTNASTCAAPRRDRIEALEPSTRTAPSASAPRRRPAASPAASNQTRSLSAQRVARHASRAELGVDLAGWPTADSSCAAARACRRRRASSRPPRRSCRRGGPRRSGCRRSCGRGSGR